MGRCDCDKDIIMNDIQKTDSVCAILNKNEVGRESPRLWLSLLAGLTSRL
jgi:hypothetical protein